MIPLVQIISRLTGVFAAEREGPDQYRLVGEEGRGRRHSREQGVAEGHDLGYDYYTHSILGDIQWRFSIIELYATDRLI